MTQEETDKPRPIKTIHEFISEINREWGRLKRGAVISIIISSILLVAFGFLFAATLQRGFVASGIILLLLLAGLLVYCIYLMVLQLRFFRKWENRMTKLFTLEERLLQEEPTAEAKNE